MVTCNDCIHRCVCPIADGCEYADEQHIRDDCEYFAPSSADVVPKSEVEWLYKQVDCLSQEVMYNDDIAKMKVDEAKDELAREIFESLEKYVFVPHFNTCFVRISKYEEIKKKYTENENV